MNEVDYTVMPLFNTPIYIKEYVPISDEEKNILKTLDYERMDTDNGYFSKDKYVLENPELVNLKEHILDCVNEFTFVN